MALNTQGDLYDDWTKYYFYLVGVSVAVFAFFVKNLEFQKLGINGYTVEVIGLLVLGISIRVCFGLITHLANTKHTDHLRSEALAELEKLGEKHSQESKVIVESEIDFASKYETLDFIQKSQKEWFSTAKRLHSDMLRSTEKTGNLEVWYSWLLFASLLILVASKVLRPYLDSSG